MSTFFLAETFCLVTVYVPSKCTIERLLKLHECGHYTSRDTAIEVFTTNGDFVKRPVDKANTILSERGIVSFDSFQCNDKVLVVTNLKDHISLL